VQTADIRDVVIQNPVIHQIAGRIVIRGGGPVPSLSLAVPPPPLKSVATPEPNSPVTGLVAEIRQILNMEADVPLKPNPDGTFLVSLPEGERRISILGRTIPSGYAVELFTYGPQDLLNNPLRIAPGTPSDISIVLKKSE
jgi:hypothetical protein